MDDQYQICPVPSSVSRWRLRHPQEPREEWRPASVRSSWKLGWWRPGSRRQSRPGSGWPPEEDSPAAATRRWRNDATQEEHHSVSIYIYIYIKKVLMYCCLYVYFFKCGRLPSRECAEVVLAALGLAPLWVKAAELVSYRPSRRCYTHSLVLAHSISSVYFQSGETEPEESGSLEHHFTFHLL